MSIADLPDHALPLSEQELLSLDAPGLTLGAHTVTHANLPSLDEDGIRDEMAGSRAWLQERTERYVDWLAYPYGHHDDVVAGVAAELFEGALRVDGGVLAAGLCALIYSKMGDIETAREKLASYTP